MADQHLLSPLVAIEHVAESHKALAEFFVCAVCQDICSSAFVLCANGAHVVCEEHLTSQPIRVCGCCETTRHNATKPHLQQLHTRRCITVNCPCGNYSGAADDIVDKHAPQCPSNGVKYLSPLLPPSSPPSLVSSPESAPPPLASSGRVSSCEGHTVPVMAVAGLHCKVVWEVYLPTDTDDTVQWAIKIHGVRNVGAAQDREMWFGTVCMQMANELSPRDGYVLVDYPVREVGAAGRRCDADEAMQTSELFQARRPATPAIFDFDTASLFVITVYPDDAWMHIEAFKRVDGSADNGQRDEQLLHDNEDARVRVCDRWFKDNEAAAGYVPAIVSRDIPYTVSVTRHWHSPLAARLQRHVNWVWSCVTCPKL